MSNYTTQLRFICESKAGEVESGGFNDIQEIISASVGQIFNFSWPIFDEAYRLPLEVKIIRHFYTREISEETFGLWQLRLQDRLNVIMPYYNQLYESELISFNPMWDVDLRTEHERANDTQNTVNETNNETKNGSANRTLDRDGNVIQERLENSTNDNVVDTTNVGIWDSKTFRSNIGGNKTQSENTRDNHNINRYSDTPQGNVNIFSTNADGTVDADSGLGNGYLTNLTVIDDDTTRHGKENTETFNDGSEEGKTIQDWTKQDKEVGRREKNTAGTEEREDKEVENTSTQDTLNGSRNAVNIGLSTEDFIQRVSGKRGGMTFSKMLNDFRETFLNIDRMVLKDLESLFIGLWE